MKKFLKKTFFSIVIVSLIVVTGVIVRVGSFENLEGYMYSLAVEETNINLSESATPSNAVSENATPSNAVPENATPSNAMPENATPSNAVPENATPSNAVPENATPGNAVPENATPSNAVSENATPSNAVSENTTPSDAVPENIIPNETNEEIESATEQVKEGETVSFLESDKMYAIILAASTLVVAGVGAIVIVNKIKKK